MSSPSCVPQFLSKVRIPYPRRLQGEQLRRRPTHHWFLKLRRKAACTALKHKGGVSPPFSGAAPAGQGLEVGSGPDHQGKSVLSSLEGPVLQRQLPGLMVPPAVTRVAENTARMSTAIAQPSWPGSQQTPWLPIALQCEPLLGEGPQRSACSSCRRCVLKNCSSVTAAGHGKDAGFVSALKIALQWDSLSSA